MSNMFVIMMTIAVSLCLFDSGNLEGQSPYVTGDSLCSNCPDD